jgi:hypothetical protein
MDWPTLELRLGTPGFTHFDSSMVYQNFSSSPFRISSIKELRRTLLTKLFQDTHTKTMERNTKRFGLRNSEITHVIAFEANQYRKIGTNSNLFLFGGVQQVDPKKIGDSSPEGRIPLKSNHGTYISPLTPSQSRFKIKLTNKKRVGRRELTSCHLRCQLVQRSQRGCTKNKNPQA